MGEVIIYKESEDKIHKTYFKILTFVSEVEIVIPVGSPMFDVDRVWVVGDPLSQVGVDTQGLLVGGRQLTAARQEHLVN